MSLRQLSANGGEAWLTYEPPTSGLFCVISGWTKWPPFPPFNPILLPDSLGLGNIQVGLPKAEAPSGRGRWSMSPVNWHEVGGPLRPQASQTLPHKHHVLWEKERRW